MIHSRSLALFFVASQVLFFAWFNPWNPINFFPLPFLLLALIPNAPIKLNRSSHALLLVGAGSLFFVLGLSKVFQEQFVSQLLILFANYLILIQAMELLRQRDDSSVNYLPGLGTLTMTLLAVQADGAVGVDVLQYAYAAFCVTLFLVLRPDLPRLVFADRPQKRKAFTLTIMLISALGIGGLFRLELERGLPQLRAALSDWRVRENQNRTDIEVDARFVQQVGLGSIATLHRVRPNAPVFRVAASSPPGYMRTISFSDFDGQRWRNPRMQDGGPQVASGKFLSPLASQQLRAVPSILFADKQSRAFRLAAESVRSSASVVIEVPEGVGKHVPIPVNATVLVGKGFDRRGLEVNAHGNVVPGGLATDKYGLLTGVIRDSKESDEYLASLLIQSKAEQELLQSLTANLFDGRSDTESRVRAVEQFFRQNFEYSLMADPSRNLQGRSPIAAFLEDKRDAHCEYFATASVLLLRAAGIPTRLSTGYLVYEFNDESDYYIAANGNAHAWAEAYDREQQRWLLVESTPGIAEYIDQYDTTTDEERLEDRNDNNLAQSNTWWDLLAEAMVAVVAPIQNFFSERRAWVLPLILLTAGFVGFFLRRRHLRGLHGESITLRSQVRKADRLAAKLGYHRQPHETCHQFAERMELSAEYHLSPLSEWYRSYAHDRYRNDKVSLPHPGPPTLRGLRSQRK